MPDQERRLLLALALTPVPLVGTSIPSYLFVRALGDPKKVVLLVVADVAMSVGFALLLFRFLSPLMLLALTLLNAGFGGLGVYLAYRASHPKVYVRDGLIEVWIPVSTFGLKGLTPEEEFRVLVDRASYFLSPYYREAMKAAFQCGSRIRVAVNYGSDEIRISKRCNDSVVTVRRKGRKTFVVLTLPY
ncbi:MAG: hypothetical protein NO115_02785 [Sulfolobales archaeon]|nr:hypothetical protein [Sulfolobales archaeon]